MRVVNLLLDTIKKEYDSYNDIRSKQINKIAINTIKLLPNKHDEVIEIINGLLKRDDKLVFPLMTIWVKELEIYDYKYFETYQSWLKNYVNRWGRCDIYCYHVLNPMFERYEDKIFKRVKNWVKSDLTYVRRAAAVVMIKSTRSFEVNTSIENIFYVTERLALDTEHHVQKGVGWLVKYAYLAYPKEVENYLRENVKDLPRRVFRYALEKFPKALRAEMMKL